MSPKFVEKYIRTVCQVLCQAPVQHTALQSPLGLSYVLSFDSRCHLLESVRRGNYGRQVQIRLRSRVVCHLMSFYV